MNKRLEIYNSVKNEILENKDKISKHIKLRLDIIKEILPLILKDKDSNIIKYLDFSDVSFDKIDVREVDFTGSIGVNLDPQKVYKKSLYKTKLGNIDFKGKSFDGVNVQFADFTNTENVNLDPQTVKGKSLYCSNVNGINFAFKLFSKVDVRGANFTGATKVWLNPQKVYGKSLRSCILNGIDFKGKSFDNVDIRWASFEGALNFKIDLTKIKEYNTNYGEIDIIKEENKTYAKSLIKK